MIPQDQDATFPSLGNIFLTDDLDLIEDLKNDIPKQQPNRMPNISNKARSIS